ncbi:early nodulin-like protein 2 [Olea europaea var. sylvestris]|uniref:early nodulin-like protein 2 n=1 Tax=Olea europaea var. sylvestris TaxID=158386 RepID=UPI000C1D11DE|nr:early nodulin-like protein 2 [Olea europaea var. sylvestris]
MAAQIYTSLVLITLLAGFTNGYQLNVGGKDGWVVNPSESYTHWAQRLRFRVNDTLLFKYEKGTDSVLEVNKEDFDNCNTNNPEMKMEGGVSIFKFDRSGPFYFITGNKTNCYRGQKLVIVVLAVRTPPHAPPPSTSHAPSPSWAAKPPVKAPAPAPTTDVDAPSHPPVAPPPHHSFASPPTFTPSVVLVSTASLVLSLGFGGFIVSS